MGVVGVRKELSWAESAKPAPLKTTRDAAPGPQSQLGIDWSSFVHPQRFDGYVREIERYKSRNDSTSYEAVYIAESGDGESPIGIPFADLYRLGQCWLEIDVVFVLFGYAHLKCVFFVEMFDPRSGNVGDERINSPGMEGEKLVLVEIAEFIQLPERMSLRRVCSLVRLNSVNLSSDTVGESPQGSGVGPSFVPVAEILGNGEVNVFRGSLPSSG